MQEVFEKIIERLEEENRRLKSLRNNCIALSDSEVNAIENKAYNFSIEIVKQEAEKFGTDTNVGSNGWIPVEEELPKTDEYILLSFSNFSIPCVGRYEEDENGGAFYVGDDDETCVSQDMFVNAWTNLPEPYQPKGE